MWLYTRLDPSKSHGKTQRPRLKSSHCTWGIPHCLTPTPKKVLHHSEQHAKQPSPHGIGMDSNLPCIVRVRQDKIGAANEHLVRTKLELWVPIEESTAKPTTPRAGLDKLGNVASSNRAMVPWSQRERQVHVPQILKCA